MWSSNRGFPARKVSLVPRAGLNLEAVVDAAVVLVDAEGLESLTLAKLAAHLGVKAPSLYNHIECLTMLKQHLTTRALQLLLNATRDAMAGVAGQEALAAFGQTKRQFAKTHPGLWFAFKPHMTGWDDAAQSVADSYLALALAIMRGYGLSGDEAIHATRVVRASLQGFIDLEMGGGFNLQQNVDRSFDTLLKMLHVSLSQYPAGILQTQLSAAN